MSKKVLIESQYLPSIEFFCAVADADEIIIEAEENFIKQTYRNRCYILGSNKVQTLIVPVEHKVKKMAEVRVNYNNKWWLEHWRSIEASYNRSPYMLYYGEALQEILFGKYERLIDLNGKLLTFCLEKLSNSARVTYTEKYERNYTEGEITDLRSQIVPKVEYAERGFYKPEPYFQQFGKAFVKNLSIIDLLMSMGPEASSVIMKSKLG
ncbi:MAG: WbqC family protein [Cyclobacteriaceae bacterium]|nr:WbqC family protein [Cyclobacteriaceae bacterium]